MFTALFKLVWKCLLPFSSVALFQGRPQGYYFCCIFPAALSHLFTNPCPGFNAFWTIKVKVMAKVADLWMRMFVVLLLLEAHK
jgi:hypothetical protein